MSREVGTGGRRPRPDGPQARWGEVDSGRARSLCEMASDAQSTKAERRSEPTAKPQRDTLSRFGYRQCPVRG